jgi:hypothetical protein
VLHFTLSAQASLQAYVVDPASSQVLLHASGSAAEQVVFACPSVGTFDLAFKPANLQATTLAVSLSVKHGKPKKRDAGEDAADCHHATVDASVPVVDAGGPIVTVDAGAVMDAAGGDGGPVGFSPSELFTTGVPVSFACTASYDGPAVFGVTLYDSGPYVLPSMFTLSANVKFIPSSDPRLKWFIETVFSPVTEESQSAELNMGLRSVTANGGGLPIWQPSSLPEGTLFGSGTTMTSVRPCNGGFRFTQTSASHFTIGVGGQCIYKGIYPSGLVGHTQKVNCQATY